MTPDQPRPFVSRLAVRFAALLALALLPAGLMALIQTNALEDEFRASSEIALLGATLQSASAETGLIGRTRGMVGSLASAVRYVVGDPTACSDLMRGVAGLEPAASLVAFIPLSGVMTCSSSGRDYDFSGNPVFRRVLDTKEPAFTVNPKGPISGTSVLGLSHPVYDDAGRYLGFATISLPHDAINELRFEAFGKRSNPDEAVFFWTFDKEGTLLTANIELEAARLRLPAGQDLRDFAGTEGKIFQATSKSGQSLTYAVVPIVPRELYVMSSFLPGVPLNDRFGFSSYVPTLLMWVISLVVAGLAAEFLVTRHVRTLNRAIVSFAQGDRRLAAITLRNAPSELNELAAAYVSMTESITRGEAELEDSLHQKEVLLREVHHRVKNNLQLISSILNIQTRSAHSGEAKVLLKNLQERIMSLATVHRGLYQTSGLADVRARELIPDIVRQILAMSSGPEKPFDALNDIDDLRLIPDQAVPLSLLLTEALTNAIKYAGATRDHPGKLTVRLKRSGGSDAVFEVINSLRERYPNGPLTATVETGIGSQLITAFVQQLGGRLEVGVSGGEYHLRVLFGLSPLILAENRQVDVGPDPGGWNISAP